jgi:hypothetical protein
VHEGVKLKNQNSNLQEEKWNEGWKGIEKGIGALRSDEWPEAMRLLED